MWCREVAGCRRELQWNCKALDQGELYSATCGDWVDVTRPDLGRVEKVGYAIRIRYAQVRPAGEQGREAERTQGKDWPWMPSGREPSWWKLV